MTDDSAMAAEGASAGASATIVRHATVVPGKEDEFIAWRGKVLAELGHHDGFLTVETYPPNADQPDWVTVERFDSQDSAVAWLESPARAALLGQAHGLVEGIDSVNVIMGPAETRRRDVTAVITNRVQPGKEAEFQAWRAEIQDVQSTYPGYRGIDVQPPIEGVNPNWVTLLRFDSAENLRHWLDSEDCARLTAESEPLMASAEYRVSRTSFANWLPEEERVAEPPAWKVNAVVLLVLYPVVMLTIVFLNPHISGLGVGPVTFIGNIIGVAATGFWLVPWAAGRLKTWLVPPAERERQITLVGSLLMVVGYAVLVLVMSLVAARFL